MCGRASTPVWKRFKEQSEIKTVEHVPSSVGQQPFTKSAAKKKEEEVSQIIT